jgi:2-dehydropantoate 2-reductase
MQNMPHIILFGAGAVGIYLAVRLARGGVPVSLIARPKTAAALRATGLCVTEAKEHLHWQGDTAKLWIGTAAEARRRQASGLAADALLITTKSQQILPALPEITPLIGATTCVVCLQNGIPWWYFQGMPGHAGETLACLDPEGKIAQALPPERTLGGVIHKSVETLAPGTVRARKAQGDRFLFGSPWIRAETAQETALRTAFRQAGLRAEWCTDLRREVWQKLLGNAVLNPLSALTGATVAAIVDFPASRELAKAAMTEALAVARAWGVTPTMTPEERLHRARAVGAARTSMLQDSENGKALEIEGILGSLLELARRAKIDTPRLETLYAAAALRSHCGTRKRR